MCQQRWPGMSYERLDYSWITHLKKLKEHETDTDVTVSNIFSGESGLSELKIREVQDKIGR